jgi:hypothetical protein
MDAHGSLERGDRFAANSGAIPPLLVWDATTDNDAHRLAGLTWLLLILRNLLGLRVGRLNASTRSSMPWVRTEMTT